MKLYTVPELIERLKAINIMDISLADAQVMYEASEALKRLSRPASEREPPHCPTCACGLHPRANGVVPLPDEESSLQCRDIANCKFPDCSCK